MKNHNAVQLQSLHINTIMSSPPPSGGGSGSGHRSRHREHRSHHRSHRSHRSHRRYGNPQENNKQNKQNTQSYVLLFHAGMIAPVNAMAMGQAMDTTDGDAVQHQAVETIIVAMMTTTTTGVAVEARGVVAKAIQAMALVIDAGLLQSDSMQEGHLLLMPQPQLQLVDGDLECLLHPQVQQPHTRMFA